MYFAMDEIGFENVDKLKAINGSAARWQFIYDCATDYGFEGIHLTPSLYRGFGLDLKEIPTYFHDFKLTLHLGGGRIVSEHDYTSYDTEITHALDIAVKHGMHDLSVHPPYANGLTSDERSQSLHYFDKIITKWLEEALHSGISLSLETHVSGTYFLFDGFDAFTSFTDRHPDLGILIDISHNYYDRYSEERIIECFGNRNVKALHISDALQGAEFRAGTHLPAGHGTVDFERLLKHFVDVPDIFGALEIKSDNDGIRNSLNRLRVCICD